MPDLSWDFQRRFHSSHCTESQRTMAGDSKRPPQSSGIPRSPARAGGKQLPRPDSGARASSQPSRVPQQSGLQTKSGTANPGSEAPNAINETKKSQRGAQLANGRPVSSTARNAGESNSANATHQLVQPANARPRPQSAGIYNPKPMFSAAASRPASAGSLPDASSLPGGVTNHNGGQHGGMAGTSSWSTVVNKTNALQKASKQVSELAADQRDRLRKELRSRHSPTGTPGLTAVASPTQGSAAVDTAKESPQRHLGNQQTQRAPAPRQQRPPLSPPVPPPMQNQNNSTVPGLQPPQQQPAQFGSFLPHQMQPLPRPGPPNLNGQLPYPPQPPLGPPPGVPRGNNTGWQYGPPVMQPAAGYHMLHSADAGHRPMQQQSAGMSRSLL